MLFRLAIALIAVLVLGLFVVPPAPAAAASCVRFTASNFNAPGIDRNAKNLNGEWVRIKNNCGKRIVLRNWRIHDKYQRHTYRFKDGVAIKPGKTITLSSGRGVDTGAKKYWGRKYRPVWNNSGEKAYLRKWNGTLVSTWTEKSTNKTKPTNCDPSYPTVCIPKYPPDLDCGQIPYRNFPVKGPDYHGFDGDDDGIGCET